MKIALVAPTPVPPAYGGMDRLLDGLRAALAERHPTDLVTVAVDERSAEGVLHGYYDFHHLDLSAYDLAISTKGPSYMIRHPAQVAYLNHRMRVFYDLYQPRGVEHARLRRLIHWLDGWGLSSERVPFIFCVGTTVQRRLLRWGGHAATVLRHPSTFQPAPPARGEHLLAVGRLHELKRFDLIIRALRASRADLPLKIVGTGPAEPALRELAGNDPRIEFLGHVGEEPLRELYARALISVFTPVNEDLGLVTLESFAAGKPVLTLSDAGEPAEIVQPGRTGFIVAPEPAALAERYEWVAAHRAETEAMGEACLAAAAEVTWARLVDALLGAGEKIRTLRRSAPGSAPHRDRRIHLLVTDNQMIDPPVGGGRLRIFELYRNLPEGFTTTFLGTHDHPGPQFRDQWLTPNFREIVMPLTMKHFKFHEIWRRLTGGDATIDVTIPLLLGKASPRYHALLAELLPAADVLVTAHPWMMPFLPGRNGAHPPLPLVYDSQNCEAAVKTPLLRRTLAGRYLARNVERVERRAVSESDLVLACSPADIDQFQSRYGAPADKIELIANGVDCRRIRPGAAAARPALRRELHLPERPLAVFVASPYGPNNDATDWLISELAPRLPGVTIGIIGGAGPAWRERHPGRETPPNVHIFGTVAHEQLPLIYAAADLGLNPVCHGSGTNIKMLDYMAAGLAMVSTDTGARGIDGRPGEHWIAAPTDRFATEVEALLAAPERMASLGAAARALAERHYDWPVISARLAVALERLVRSRA